ncbi:hypothetical protein WME97_22355 [Sorangium sp. So ce367]|uniref:hypothetical protein n=1 Tax=Sorangium sp. So ce367 TaxID=3133305 RepID=UPI003F603687
MRDLALERREILVRHGKGSKDRITMLPLRLVPSRHAHLSAMRTQYAADVAASAGRVTLPDALDRKYPNAGRNGTGNRSFPRRGPIATGQLRRHHLHESVLQRAVREAALSAGLSMRASCHTPRHSFAPAGVTELAR